MTDPRTAVHPRQRWSALDGARGRGGAVRTAGIAGDLVGEDEALARLANDEFQTLGASRCIDDLLQRARALGVYVHGARMTCQSLGREIRVKDYD